MYGPQFSPLKSQEVERKSNEDQHSNNVKIVDHEVRLNAKAIYASITAIEELFNQNALLQDEIVSSVKL